MIASRLDDRAPVRETPSMPYGALSFVGRERELEELGAAIGDARGGQGGVWLLCGEPGSGKSRLAEELVRGRTDQITAYWGRCWEAGGAPTYWPWIQILRALLRDDERAFASALRAPYLAQLMPEVVERLGAIEEAPSLEAEQARFRLLDAIGSTIFEAAAKRPLLLILEDLHAADPSSLMLLDYLADQSRGARLVIVGTFRDAEAEHSSAGRRLLRIAQKARTIPLGRLDRDAVARFLEHALETQPPAALVDAAFARTEGNPLFLVELSRLLIGGAPADRAGVATSIPGGVRAAIRERLDRLSPGAREALEMASVLGRDVPTQILADAFDRDPVALAEALSESTRAALLQDARRGELRFAHILIRDVVYDGLEPPRRHALHLAAAEALEALGAGGGDTPWSEIAHHYLAAQDAGSARAVDACERAGASAMQQLAFEEAADAYAAALGALRRGDAPNRAREAELLLGYAGARIRGGDGDEGRRSCRAAAAIARDLDHAELLTRAALQYGSIYLFAQVDEELVALLSEALERLGDRHPALRARALSRLAAALQPAADPHEPVALAREAILMARRSGDPRALLSALGAGGSAMMDLVDAAERRPLNEEHVALAEKLADPADALRGCTRLAFDCFELRDLAGAEAALARVERLAGELRHPTYQWRAVALRATRALWEGRFDEAEQLIEEARALGERGGDANALKTSAYQRARLHYLRGQHDELPGELRAFHRLFRGSVSAGAFSAAAAAAGLYRIGCAEEGEALLAELEPQSPLVVSDRTLIEALADIASATGDTELAGAAYERARHQSGRLVSGGVIGMTWDGPVTRVLGVCARALGRIDEASDWFDEASRTARALGGRPVAALVQCEHAEMLLARSGAGDRERAASLLDDAERSARDLGMAGVLARIERCRRNLVSGAATGAPAAGAAAVQGERVEAFRLVREGEFWSVECQGATIRLKDIKGLQILARLVSQPEREFHVLDLEHRGRDAAEADRGDAGELLDDHARDSYRQRIRELRRAIDEAEQWNDTARAERARAELEMLSSELSRAVGLGGRSRRSGTAAERARINIQRRLRDAIRRIEREHPALGKHLARSVKTGVYCRYSPG